VTALASHQLGRTGIFLTELSLGCAALGNLFSPVDDETATATVDAAWSMGVRTFDTAPHYGLGLSERRLGAAVRARPRDEFVVSTKVGRRLEPVDPPYAADTEGFAVPATHVRRFDFSADGVQRSLESSLDRLGLDRVDIALLHDPTAHVEQAIGQAYPALARMRDEGVVGAIGAGMNDAATLARFVTETDIDVVLLAGRYTLLDRSGADLLLPAAAERGVGVVVGGVFNSGLLADPHAPDARFDYQSAPAEMVARARRLDAICTAYGVPLRAVAARFPLGHPAVASVLIGARSPAEITDAVRLRDHPIPAQLWDALEEDRT
jgi:D-threo-aldose 1-dehydrogenase